MKRNSRLSLALHTLSHMARDPDRVRTSKDIAEHAGTNPVVVRRVLGKLREAGLLTSDRGHAGGWKLAKPPLQITLADVYVGLGESLIATEEQDNALSCTVEHALRRKVSNLMSEVETSLIAKLGETTIAEL